MPTSLVSEFLRAMRSDPRFDWKTPFKTFAFALGHPVLTWRWASYLKREAMRELWRNEPRLIDKPLRPYLNSAWTVSQRVSALRSHYDWLEHRFGATQVQSLFVSEQPAVLARWALGEQASAPHVSLQLAYCGAFEREGDLSLALTMEPDPLSLVQSPLVLALTFGVARVNGQMSLCIGCVQARKHPGTRGQLAELTRLQHGMRPRALLIHVARLLARRWQLKLLGIDPSRHAFASFRYQMSRSKRELLKSMRGSYEELWQDAQGQRQADGWWTLPTLPVVRTAQDIPTRKRSMYARRQRWLDGIEQSIGSALDTLERADNES